MQRLLEQVGYRIVRQKGSHRRMEAEGRAPLTLSFHDGATVPPRVVRNILQKDAGLTDEEVIRLLWPKKDPGR